MFIVPGKDSPQKRIKYYLIRALITSVVAFGFYLADPEFKFLFVIPLVDLSRAAFVLAAQKYMQSKQR